MNFTAKIKSARYKPNYILNVNIDIPLRPDQIMSDRPLSGEFTFSPSQLKKKLKLEVPYHSTRTTREAESRKISSSYLGDTLNSIPHLNNGVNNNRKRGTKSNYPCHHQYRTSNLNIYTNGSRKSKNKSESVSPKKKLLGTMKDSIKQPKIKDVKSARSIRNNYSTNNAKILAKLASINQSEDNIIKYTNNTPELQESKSRSENPLITQTFSIYEKQKQFRESLKDGKDKFKKQKRSMTLKTSQVLSSQQFQLVAQMREFEKKSQQKKQHIHYEYLKEKILVLASVKKIQRAWRNYKTKKLLKSYSNDISLRFTHKMQDSIFASNIMTSRSLEVGNFNKNKKVNFLEKHKPDKVQSHRENGGNDCQSGRPESSGENSVSAKRKFQMQQIQKWEELIKNIRQGKQVQQVLESSFRRKEELEKQLKGYKKREKKEKKKHQKHTGDGKCKFFQGKQPQKIKPEKGLIRHRFQLQNSDQPVFIYYDASLSSSSLSNNSHKQFPKSSEVSSQQNRNLIKKTKHQEIDADSEHMSSQECGDTTYRRRKKLEQFESEIRRIDNQQSSINQFENQNPYICEYRENNLEEDSNDSQKQLSPEEKEKLENLKLRKKLLLFNKLHFGDLKDPEAQSQINKETTDKQKNQCQKADFEIIPEKISIGDNGDIQEVDKLETYRQKVLAQEKQEEFNLPEQSIKQNVQEFRRQPSQSQRKELCNRIQDQLVFEALLQFSESDQIVNKIKEIYDKTLNDKTEKPEGICTNLQSIKDYLQNLVAFIYEQYPRTFGQGFSKKYTSIKDKSELVSALRKGNHQDFINKNMSSDSLDSNMILTQQLFNEHWNYASEQIYFDRKYQNEQQEQERINYLKNITKIYFKAIFTGFNQCLNSYRPLYPNSSTNAKYSSLDLMVIARLLSENISSQILNNSAQQKYFVRSAYKKLSNMAVVYCGIHLQDKQHSLSEQMVKQIQQQRLGTLLQMEITDSQPIFWGALGNTLQFFKVNWDIAQNLISEALLQQATYELNQCLKSSHGCLN